MKYNDILKQVFNESVLTELEASDIDKQKVIKNIIDYAKKNNHSREDILAALDMIKDSRVAANPEEAPPENYSSTLGSPDTLESIKKWAGRAASVVIWAVSKENEKAGAVLNSISGKTSAAAQHLLDKMKKGEADAKTLNAQLKSICKQLKDSEASMDASYKEMSSKITASGGDVKKMLDAARKKHATESNSKALKDIDVLAQIKKTTKKSPPDQKFINDIKVSIPEFDNLLQSATSAKPDKDAEPKLIDGMKKYLNGPGAAKYPYLSEEVDAANQNKAIKTSIADMANKSGTILQMSAEAFKKYKEDTKGGQLEGYFAQEDSMNKTLDHFAELILSIKKELVISDLQAKTKLSKNTINNWIEYEKKISGNQEVVAAIGNQQAQ